MHVQHAIFTGKPLSSNLLMLQNALGDTHAPMPGALKFKVCRLPTLGQGEG